MTVMDRYIDSTCFQKKRMQHVTHTDLTLLKDEFDSDGFVVLRNYLNAEELTEMHDHIDHYAQTIQSLDEIPGGAIKGMDQHDAWFHEYLEHGKHVPIMKHMLGDGLAPDNVTWLNKTKSTQRTMPHYDAIGSYLTPPSGISLWIAMDYIDSRNGCLHYEKGSHLRNLPSTYPLRDYDEHNVNVVPIMARPGDAVMHRTRVIHFSIDVIEERPRNAMVFAYWGGSSRIDPALVARSRSAYTEHRVIL